MILWYLCFLLPVITFAGHFALTRGTRRPGRIVELWLINIVFWGVGVAGLFGFLTNSCGFMNEWIANKAGWSAGGPFQYALGVGLLSFGVLGVFAPTVKGGFLFGTILVGVTYGIGEGFMALLGDVPMRMLIYTLVYDWGGSAIVLGLTALYWSRAGSKTFWKSWTHC